MISLPGSTVAFSFGSKPRIESEVTDLPLPDSLTSATVELVGISKLMPLTASKFVSLSSRKLTRRLRIESSGAVIVFFRSQIARAAGRSWSFQFRVQCVAQGVGEQAERGHEQRHEGPGRRQLPPFPEDQLVLRLVQHRAPRDDVDRDAKAEERKNHLGLDEGDRQYRKLDQHDVADVRQDVHEHAPG